MILSNIKRINLKNNIRVKKVTICTLIANKHKRIKRYISSEVISINLEKKNNPKRYYYIEFQFSFSNSSSL